MTNSWAGESVSFRRAATADTGVVLAVLDEAAAWLRRRGVARWPERFKRSWIEGAVEQGDTWLVWVRGAVAGTVTLDWSDPLWDEEGGRAGYVHRMAIRRHAAGLGGVILDWTADTVRQHERELLRLDCVATNEILRSYYEARGFIHCGDVPAAVQRADRPVTYLSRYELALGEEGTGRSVSRIL